MYCYISSISLDRYIGDNIHCGGFSSYVCLTLSLSLSNVSKLNVKILRHHVKNTYISLVNLLHSIAFPLKLSLVALCFYSFTLLLRKSIVIEEN